MNLAYDITKTYQFNYDCGPVLDAPPPEVPETPQKDFLGVAVNSQLGISAGILLNSRWIECFAQRGFDILTYKTVRSVHRPCYQLPNWVFVEDDGDPAGPVYALPEPPADLTQASSSVCFGMPSMSPVMWRPDVHRAKSLLRPGQMLIVSVVATPGERPTPEEVAADYARCAQWAAEAGADAVEANFSCPNVCSAEGSIYLDVEFSKQIALKIREAIGTKPLLIKLGYLADQGKMRRLLHVLNGVANGVTLVNTISRPVLHRDGSPVFGRDYTNAGVLGRIIHEPCVRMVQDTVRLIQEDWLELSVAAVGGVSTVQDVQDFFDAGVNAVLMGSSPAYLPNLAAEIKSTHPEW
ncbi:MAG: hypothetical protein AB1705_17325 [Verrucomicrobiota bacterium]